MEFDARIINLAITLSGLMLCILGSVVLSVEKHLERKTTRFFGFVLFIMLAGDMEALNSFHGEYMSRYSWAELTTGSLTAG